MTAFADNTPQFGWWGTSLFSELAELSNLAYAIYLRDARNETLEQVRARRTNDVGSRPSVQIALRHSVLALSRSLSSSALDIRVKVDLAETAPTAHFD